MTNWRKTIRLKDLFDEDTSDTATRQAARSFYDRLRDEPEYTEDFDYAALVLEFLDISDAQSDGSDVFGGRFTLSDWFNDVLNSLYDWADSERIWID